MPQRPEVTSRGWDAVSRAALLLLAAVFAVGGLGAPVGAQEAPPDPDDVVRRELLVVDGAGDRLDEGDGATLFGVELEGADECPGDSANDQYRIDSYLVPVEVDPTQLLYAAQGPTPPAFRSYDGFQMPLHKVSTEPYSGELTLLRQEPGGPGPIPELPEFTFGVYVPTIGLDDYDGGLPSGEYRMGIACTFGARTTNLWETTIEIAQDPDDQLVGIAWTVTGAQRADLASTGSDAGRTNGPAYVLLAFGGVMAVVAVALYASSKRGRSAEASVP